MKAIKDKFIKKVSEDVEYRDFSSLMDEVAQMILDKPKEDRVTFLLNICQSGISGNAIYPWIDIDFCNNFFDDNEDEIQSFLIYQQERIGEPVSISDQLSLKVFLVYYCIEEIFRIFIGHVNDEGLIEEWQ